MVTISAQRAPNSSVAPAPRRWSSPTLDMDILRMLASAHTATISLLSFVKLPEAPPSRGALSSASSPSNSWLPGSRR